MHSWGHEACPPVSHTGPLGPCHLRDRHPRLSWGGAGEAPPILGDVDGGGVDADASLLLPELLPGDLCPPGGYRRFAGVSLAPGYDSLTVYRGREVLDSLGISCEHATDGAACQAAVEALRAGYGAPSPGGVGTHFVATTPSGPLEITHPIALAPVVGGVTNAATAALAMATSHYQVVCPGAGSREVPGSIELVLRLPNDCGPIRDDLLRVSRDGRFTILQSVVVGQSLGCVGRRFEELAAVPASAEDTLGEFLAKLAYLEAASVDAFARLEAELAHHGAPAHLLKRVRRARRDEVRHAATMTKLAASHGGVVPPVEMPVRPVPALEEIARENRVEGCLRETYGAAVGAFQAARAEDRAIGGAMVSIARDEAAHAELSWAIDAWAVATLDGAAHKRLDAAYDAALAELRREIAVEPGETVATRAGIPTAAQASALLEGVLTVLATAA